MTTQIQITLYKEVKASHAEIVALLTKVYDFATNEGYEVRGQTTTINP